MKTEDKTTLALAQIAPRFLDRKGTLERVCEAHMKARNPKPISPEAARFAKQDLIKYGPGRGTFYSLVKRHIPDKSVVNSKAV